MPLKSAKSAYANYQKSVLAGQKRLIRSQNLSQSLNSISNIVDFAGALAQYRDTNLKKKKTMQIGAEEAGIDVITGKRDTGSLWTKFIESFKKPDMSQIYENNGYEYSGRQLYNIGRMKEMNILDYYLGGKNVSDVFGNKIPGGR